ncbi:DUF2913 family protein [Kluyvera intermedia]|uniref:DUF2913 family protein n=1 Tax=Kluyvera intermedia TaxID=61648 RepID=UPI0035252874
MKYEPTTPVETLTDLAHLAWCGLVALKLARQDGLALSPLLTHTFLNRWLATAQKQKRFPKTVAIDITSLLDLSRRKGPGADLEKRLADLWQSCTEPVADQSDLFRLTYVIEQLRAQGWINAVVTDEEWHSTELLTEYRGSNALLVRKSELQAQFAQDGRLTGEVVFLLTGDRDAAEALFSQHNLKMAFTQREENGCQATLTPQAECTD